MQQLTLCRTKAFQLQHHSCSQALECASSRPVRSLGSCPRMPARSALPHRLSFQRAVSAAGRTFVIDHLVCSPCRGVAIAGAPVSSFGGHLCPGMHACPRRRRWFAFTRVPRVKCCETQAGTAAAVRAWSGPHDSALGPARVHTTAKLCAIRPSRMRLPAARPWHLHPVGRVPPAARWHYMAFALQQQPWLTHRMGVGHDGPQLHCYSVC